MKTGESPFHQAINLKYRQFHARANAENRCLIPDGGFWSMPVPHRFQANQDDKDEHQPLSQSVFQYQKLKLENASSSFNVIS